MKNEVKICSRFEKSPLEERFDSRVDSNDPKMRGCDKMEEALTNRTSQSEEAGTVYRGGVCFIAAPVCPGSAAAGWTSLS